MKNNVVLGSFLLVVGLVGCKHSSGAQASPRQAAAVVPVQESQPLFAKHSDTLTEQRMCDEQGLKRFRQQGYKTGDYRSHYDPSVNVCYVSVATRFVDKEPVISIDVLDAFEGREFASFFWSNPKKKPYQEVAAFDL